MKSSNIKVRANDFAFYPTVIYLLVLCSSGFYVGTTRSILIASLSVAIVIPLTYSYYRYKIRNSIKINSISKMFIGISMLLFCIFYTLNVFVFSSNSVFKGITKEVEYESNKEISELLESGKNFSVVTKRNGLITASRPATQQDIERLTKIKVEKQYDWIRIFLIVVCISAPSIWGLVLISNGLETYKKFKHLNWLAGT